MDRIELQFPLVFTKKCFHRNTGSRHNQSLPKGCQRSSAQYTPFKDAVLDEIASATGNHSLKYFQADLSNIRNLDNLANDIKREYDSIDILINNAGAYFSQYIETEEQLEMTFALNHLSYFQLTMLLIDVIEFEIPGRVINVASSAHFRAKLD